MTAIDPKRLFDAVRAIKGKGLTQPEVDTINAILAGAPLPLVPLTPREFIAGFIRAHEGALSMRADDNGNWYDPARFKAGLPQRRNAGKLVGSKFGVTAYAVASFRDTADITAADIAALTIEEAIDIGVHLYFDAPGFAKLPWDRVTASIVDKGWGSGPKTAIKMLQGLIGVGQDGKIGDLTVAADVDWRSTLGEEKAALAWAQRRIAFDTGIATNEGAKDPDRVFLKGWTNRTNSFLPGTPWWNAFYRRAA
ncbi:glycosyl hydrolase 108 family protein [Sphingomonas sp.]|uniref:glycosyl hydrolase 108 family protein n=1 Tax=Sphingomonas sp. TaxID=28214 RepID=UPI003B3B1680